MNAFRSIRCRRFAATFAALALLMQAGLTALHGTAMFAYAAGNASGHAGMMCHGDGADGQTPDGANGNGSHNTLRGCSCCLGMVASAAALPDADIAFAITTESRDTTSSTGIAGGRQPLSPQGRGPPNLV